MKIMKKDHGNIKVKRRTILLFVFGMLSVVGMFLAINLKNDINKNEIDPELARAMTYGVFTEEDELVSGTDNVKFNAFFLRDINNDGYAEKIKGTCKKVGDQDSLYMSINVSTEGTLKNGKIFVEANNIYFQTAIIADESIKDNYISNNTSTIDLKDLSVGTQKIIFGNVRSGDYSEDSKKMDAIKNDVSKYSGINKVIFTGIYVTDDGEEINVRKEVDLTVDWYNMPEAEIPEKYNDKIDNENQKYDLLGMIDATNKTINLNFNITVQEKGNISKLQKSCIEGRLPELNGYAPISVKVEGGNVNYTYDDSTRLLSAYKEAVLNSNGNLIKQCYNGEYQGKRFSTFSITATYPIDVYYSIGVDTLIMDVPVKGWFEAYNNPNEEFENPVKSNIVENVITATFEKGAGDVIGFDVKVGRYVGEEYDSWVVSKNNSNKYYVSAEDLEDTYEVLWIVARGNDGKVSNVKLKEQVNNYTDKFLKSDGTYIDIGDIVQNKGIYFSGAQTMFDSNAGYIDVINDETDELIHRFDSSDWSKYNKSNPYLYSSKVTHIRIETSETKNNSGLFVYNIKEINHEKLKATYSQDEFNNFIYIASYLEASIKNNDTDAEYTIKKNDSEKANFDGEKSIAKIKSISTDTYSTQETKENVQLVIATEQLNYNTSKWKNGEFILKFPKEIFNVKINDIQCLEKDVKISGYSLEEKDDEVYIRILTENENPTTFDVYLDLDISPDPSVLNASKDIELYYINPECEMYLKAVQDIYDVNDDGNIKEYVGKAIKNIQLIGPASMATFEKASEHNDNGDELKTVIAPKIAVINKSDEEKDAKVTVEILNNYSGSIEEIKVVGKIPFKGNTFQLKDKDLGSVYSTTMISKILVPANLQGIAKVYYSENEKVSEDLNDEKNNWIEESKIVDLSNVKNFLIDLSGYSMQKGESADFTYEIKVPSGLNYNDVSYATHAVYFSLKTEEGKLRDKTETNKLGFMIAKKYNVKIQKVKEDTEIGLKDARYQLIDEVDNSSSIAKTKDDGTLSFNNLYVNRKYILKEIKAPVGYNKAESIEFETFVNDDGKIEFNVLNGSIKAIEDVENEILPTKKLVLENLPLFNFKIKKVSKGTNDGIADVEYEIQKVGDGNVAKYKTNTDGVINIKNLETDVIYELREVKANGYYVSSVPVRFKVFRKDGEYRVEIQKGEVRESKVVSNAESRDIPEVTFVIDNEKIPVFSLRINKYSKDSDKALLPNASFKISGPGIDGEATYTTDENGTMIIDNLYLYQDGKNVDCIYTIKESVPPVGYCLNNEEVKVKASLKTDGTISVEIVSGTVKKTNDENDIQIDQNNKIVTIGLVNEPIFKLTKIDGTTKEKLPNVKFAIFSVDENGNNSQAFDVNGNVVGEAETIDDVTYQVIATDANGEINLELPEGIYKVIEIEALEGYKIGEELASRTYYFGIGKSQDEIKKWITERDDKLGNQYEIYKIVASVDGGYYEIGRMSGYVRILGDETASGNIIEVQAYNSEVSPCIIKRNSENKVEYVKIIKATDIAEFTLAENTPDGGFIAVGHFFGTLMIDEEDTVSATKEEITGPAYMIAKYNSDCKLEYIHKIDTSNKTAQGWMITYDKLKEMTVQTNGDYILCGYISKQISFPAEDTELGKEVVINEKNEKHSLIIKYNKEGKIKWASCLSGSGREEYSNVVTDEKNNIYVFGDYSGNNVIVPYDQTASGEEIDIIKNTRYNYMIIKYNEDGKVIYAKGLNSVINNMIPGVDDVSLYIYNMDQLTISANESTTGKEITVDPANGYEVCIKFDSNMKVETIKPLLNQLNVSLKDVVRTSDNGLIFNVTYSSDIVIPSNETVSGKEIKLLYKSGEENGCILKVNSNMKVEWEIGCYFDDEGMIELNNSEIIMHTLKGNILKISKDGQIQSKIDAIQGKIVYTSTIYTSDGGKLGVGNITGVFQIYADRTVNNKEIILDGENGKDKFAVVKYNSENKVEWARGFNWTTLVNMGSKIVETDDGYYFTVGISSGFTVDAEDTVDGKEISEQYTSIDVIHLNKEGKIKNIVVMENQKNAPMLKIDIAKGKNGIAVSIELYEEGLIIPAEYTASGTEMAIMTDGSQDQLIVAINKDGKAIWGHDISAAGNSWLGGITGTEDGGYIANGTFWWPITFNANETVSGEIIKLTSTGAYDEALIKYNKDGLVEWAINQGGTGRDYAEAISATSDNGFISVGYFNSSNYTIPTEKTVKGEPIILNPVKGYDGFVTKYDENHLVEWAISIGGNSTVQIKKVIEIEDGYLVTGSFSGEIVIPAEKTANGTEIKFDVSASKLTPIIKLNKQGLVERIFLESLAMRDYKDGKILLGGYGPVLEEMYQTIISPDVAEKKDITIENDKKQYSILTEVANENSGEKGGTISGEYEKPYEIVTYGEDSTKEIKVVPEAGYKILKITVNDKQIDFSVAEDGSVILDKFKNVTSDLKVVVKFSKTVSNITVHYYKDGTTENLASDEVLRGEVGSNYTTAPKEIENYVLVMDKLPYNASGKYPEYDDDVYYYYKEKPCKLIVHYYEEGTETELVPTIESEVDKGSEYATKEPENMEDKYELVAVPVNATGTIDANEVIVNYYYRIKVLNIVTEVEKHKEMDEFGELVEIGGGTIVGDEQVTYGENSTKNIVVKSDDGYHVARITVNAQEVKFTETDGQVELDKFIDVTEDKIIKVEFAKSSSRIVVHFYEEGTTNKLSENIIIQGKEGDEYKTEPATDVPSKYELSVTPENATGVMTDSTIDIIYYYRVKDAILTIKYLEKNTDLELAAEEVQHGKVEENYRTDEKQIDGYVLVEHVGDTEGKFKEGENVVIFYYVKRTVIIVKYLDKDTGNEIADMVTIDGKNGDEYTTEPKEIPGYVMVEEPEIKSGTMTDENIELVYYYRRPARVVTKYFDKDTGDEIETCVTQDGYQNDEYTTEAKDIKYYKLIATPDNATGTMKVTVTKDENGKDIVEDTTYVTYYYRKLIFNLNIDKKVSSVTVNGEESIINGDLGKVEVHRKELNTAKVEVKYIIKVTNDSELTGKASILEDIPTGMIMNTEKNAGWEVKGTTATRETKELQPGESEEYLVVLDWENGENNIGMKENTASIISTENEAGFEEKDTTDNEDKADIIVAIGTGGHTYVLIAGGILLVMIALACGVYVVKKVKD